MSIVVVRTGHCTATMDTKFSFYEPATPPRVAADGGGDSTVDPSVTMFSDQSNIEENHHKITTGSNDRCIVASSSYESCDSIMSSSDSSDNTERANNKEPPSSSSAEDNVSVAGTAMSSACISNSSFEKS